jgi:hypothetical protein
VLAYVEVPKGDTEGIRGAWRRCVEAAIVWHDAHVEPAVTIAPAAPDSDSAAPPTALLPTAVPPPATPATAAESAVDGVALDAVALAVDAAPAPPLVASLSGNSASVKMNEGAPAAVVVQVASNPAPVQAAGGAGARSSRQRANHPTTAQGRAEMSRQRAAAGGAGGGAAAEDPAAALAGFVDFRAGDGSVTPDPQPDGWGPEGLPTSLEAVRALPRSMQPALAGGPVDVRLHVVGGTRECMQVGGGEALGIAGETDMHQHAPRAQRWRGT